MDHFADEGHLQKRGRPWDRAERLEMEGPLQPTGLEGTLEIADVVSAASLVLTNALIGAWPVATLDGRTLAVDPAVLAFNAWLARQ